MLSLCCFIISIEEQNKIFKAINVWGKRQKKVIKAFRKEQERMDKGIEFSTGMKK